VSRFPQLEEIKPESYKDEFYTMAGILSRTVQALKDIFSKGISFEDNIQSFYFEGTFSQADFPMVVRNQEDFAKDTKSGSISQIYVKNNPTEIMTDVIIFNWFEDANGIKISLSGLQPDKSYFIRWRFE